MAGPTIGGNERPAQGDAPGCVLGDDDDHALTGPGRQEGQSDDDESDRRLQRHRCVPGQLVQRGDIEGVADDRHQSDRDHGQAGELPHPRAAAIEGQDRDRHGDEADSRRGGDATGGRKEVVEPEWVVESEASSDRVLDEGGHAEQSEASGRHPTEATNQGLSLDTRATMEKPARAKPAAVLNFMLACPGDRVVSSVTPLSQPTMTTRARTVVARPATRLVLTSRCRTRGFARAGGPVSVMPAFYRPPPVLSEGLRRSGGRRDVLVQPEQVVGVVLGLEPWLSRANFSGP